MLEKKIYKIITFFLLCLGFISSFLTRKRRISLGRFIGLFMRLADRKRREITLDNIMRAFPDKDSKWHKHVMKESYCNLAITLLELLALKSMKEEEIREYIKYKNIELINEVHSRGKGLLLLSGHFGNWELLAYTAGLYSGIPVMVIVKPQKNIYADRILNSYRTRGGNSIIPMDNAAKGIIRQIMNKNAVALLADQSGTYDKDVFVDFFGRPAATYEAPANLALRFDVPIIMGFAVRQDDGTYFVELIEIKHDDLQNNKEGVEELTQRHVKALEAAIRKNPGLWTWQHRRWKHSSIMERKNETARN